MATDLRSKIKARKNNNYLPLQAIKSNQLGSGGCKQTKQQLANLNFKDELTLTQLQIENMQLKREMAELQEVKFENDYWKSKVEKMEEQKADLAKDFDKLKNDLKNVKSELKVIRGEKEGLQIQAKVNKALKKTLRIQQELLEIAKCHIKGVPVQKKDMEREVRMMLIEQFGQEAMEHFGKEATEKSCIETEDGEILKIPKTMPDLDL